MLTKKTTSRSETIKSPYAALASKTDQSTLKTIKTATAKPTATTTGTTPKPSAAKNITQKPTSEPLQPSKTHKTRLVVKYNVGFNNTLFIRGSGLDLSWEKGIALKNIGIDEWVWETDAAFSTCEFKVLINDKTYEIGDNHRIGCNSSIQYSPQF